MARKNRSIAGFGEVANEKINDNSNNNVNSNGNIDIDDNKEDDVSININNNDDLNEVDENKAEDEGMDYLDQLIEGGKKKKDESVLTGIYLQKDIAQILDRLGKKGGRGAKSRIVNDSLRKVFAEKGLL
ncbi:hypothetical protein [Ammoniphilus resinae]|uniref:Rho termination factor N-terminal domain-containing protein n=1 Tax=Ammoniphilus resinae TaxID=861532 RepID=A0ABS4GX81_9BACL|nr:hypothetical protein [Ammoniphilus resinae]